MIGGRKVIPEARADINRQGSPALKARLTILGVGVRSGAERRGWRAFARHDDSGVSAHHDGLARAGHAASPATQDSQQPFASVRTRPI